MFDWFKSKPIKYETTIYTPVERIIFAPPRVQLNINFPGEYYFYYRKENELFFHHVFIQVSRILVDVPEDEPMWIEARYVDGFPINRAIIHVHSAKEIG